MNDSFFEFITLIHKSTDYLKIPNLKNGYSYTIYARNAYVGIWDKTEKAFLISRYKVGSNPFLFREYHWDTGEPYGTVKPLKLIEKSPFELTESVEENEKQRIMQYLDELEESNPVVAGVNSLQKRKISAIKFGQRLAEGVQNSVSV